MTRYLKELKPTTITDIMAMIALFRPGPMANIPTYIKRKHGQEPITYPDPRLKKILKKLTALSLIKTMFFLSP